MASASSSSGATKRARANLPDALGVLITDDDNLKAVAKTFSLCVRGSEETLRTMLNAPKVDDMTGISNTRWEKRRFPGIESDVYLLLRHRGPYMASKKYYVYTRTTNKPSKKSRVWFSPVEPDSTAPVGVPTAKKQKTAFKKMALLIGIAELDRVPRLPGVQEDVDLMAANLEHNGYVVSSHHDLDGQEFFYTVRKFVDDLSDAKDDRPVRAVVYYAGHGQLSEDGEQRMVASDNSSVEIQKCLFGPWAQRKCRADDMLCVVFDACRVPDTREPSRPPGWAPRQTPPKPANAFVMYPCARGATSTSATTADGSVSAGS